MGTVTSRDLANVQAALGGSNPISMSEYYRGGAYVPTTRATLVTEGPTYSIEAYDFAYASSPSISFIYWATASGYPNYSVSGEVTSYTVGGVTYYRGSYVQRTGGTFGGYTYHYQISRQYYTSTTINTGVPSSGTISLNQLLGAANP
jgi:hypothetical protein